VDSTNCASTSQTCYYSANNASELSAAFVDIAGKVAGCTYELSDIPEYLNYLFVYLDYQNGANPVRIERPTSWSYDATSNSVTIQGTACDLVKSGTVIPVVIEGCYDGE